MKKQSRSYGDKGKEVKKRYRRPVRLVRGVDFQRIENAPLNRFEKEVQGKIAVPPEVLDHLIQEEQMEMLSEALDHAGLTESERLCIKLILEGVRPIQIARKLKVGNGTVHNHLSRARAKIRAFLSEKFGLKK